MPSDLDSSDLLNHMPFAMLREAVDAKKVEVNRPLQLRLDPLTVIHFWDDWLETVHPEDRHRYTETRAERWTAHVPYLLEVRCRLRSESANGSDASGLADWSWCSIRSQPLFATNGDWLGYLTEVIDVDDRKQLEIDLIQLNATLENRVRQRSEDLESFAYSVSHDLRAPLRAIGAYARSLRERESGRLALESEQLLVQLHSNVERVSSLIEDLLRYAHSSVGVVTHLNIKMDELVSEILEDVQPRLDRAGRSVEWIIRRLPGAYADPVLIRTVLENLMDNALKFSQGSAPCQIEIGHDGSAFFVADNGIGFDPQFASGLFGVFHRLHADSAYKGLGVGLAVAKRIVERHGGRIWAEGHPGQGAVFKFTLPG